MMMVDLYTCMCTFFHCSTSGIIPVRWTAPEGLANQKFSAASDVWSFGIVCIEVYTDGATPYPGITSNPNVMAFVTGADIHPQPPSCTAHVYRELCRCWAFEPDQRPTFEDMHSVFASLQAGCEAGVGDTDDIPLVRPFVCGLVVGRVSFLLHCVPLHPAYLYRSTLSRCIVSFWKESVCSMLFFALLLLPLFFSCCDRLCPRRNTEEEAAIYPALPSPTPYLPMNTTSASRAGLVVPIWARTISASRASLIPPIWARTISASRAGRVVVPSWASTISALRI